MQIERELGVWELKLYMVNEISNDPSPGNCGVCSRRLYEAFYTKKNIWKFAELPGLPGGSCGEVGAIANR